MKGFFSGKVLTLVMISLIILLAGGLYFFYELNNQNPTEDKEPTALVATSPTEVVDPPLLSESRLSMLVEKYSNLGLTDVHNHDANGSYLGMLKIWERTAVKRVVLFGSVSEPAAIFTDAVAWAAYKTNPELFVPFFSGFDLHNKSSLDVVKSNLEKGYMGLGEIVAASTQSPIVSKVRWKAKDPMDGYLPQIYELCAEYKAPILLHIDPPSGSPIQKLEEALTTYPDTTFIFGHINAFNSPKAVEALMKEHPNLYADFFAGFTELSAGSAYTLEDFIPLIRQFPDRFLLSTDSGYGLESEEAAIESMYSLIDLLEDPVLARKVAHDNFAALIEAVPATKTQLEAIAVLENESGRKLNIDNSLTKLEAGKILADN